MTREQFEQDKLILLEAKEDDYTSLNQKFYNFMVSTLEYYLEIFKDEAFEGEMEMLPSEAKAAVYLNQMYGREGEDREGQISDLRLCAKAYPELGHQVKRFAKLIGEQQDAVTRELQQMVGLMKEKIRQMQDANMKEEALSVVAQVRALAPEDRELIRMEEDLKGIKRDVVVSISMLASNRPESTIRCLESLEPLREKVPCELIIVDTGCSPELRNALAKYADVITSFEWCKDFSKARNAGLTLARGEWFMYLDDDEWFTDIEPIIQFFVSGEYKEYGAASYIQRNYLDMEGFQYSDSWVGRMIKLTPETRFVSKIHEYLAPASGKSKSLHAIVDHYGYVYETEEAKWNHYKRNESLILEMMEEEPDEIRWKLQLLLEYRGVDEYQKLIDFGTKCLKEYENKELQEYERMALGTYYAAIILGLKGQEKHSEVLDWVTIANEDTQNKELAKTFMALHGANAAFYCKEYEKSIAYAEEYLRWDRFFTEHEQMLIDQQKVPFIWEVFDIVKKKEIYSLLICDGLKMKDTTYLKKYFNQLHWDEKHLYVFEEIMPVLVEALEEMESCDIFDTVRNTMKNHSALWQYYNQILQKYNEEKA